MENNKEMTNNQATRTFSSALGILVGFAGVEHGIFEFLQGNVKPNTLLVDAIGPEHKMWEFATETVLTIIPNMRISGIFSIILGLLVILWAYLYIDKKEGPMVHLVLSVILFLVGGGFAPIFLALLAFFAATRINKPLRFWLLRIPASLRNIFAMLWPWSLTLSILSFVVAVEIAIVGQPLAGLVGAETAYRIQFFLGLVTLILAIVALPSATAHDSKRRANLI